MFAVGLRRRNWPMWWAVPIFPTSQAVVQGDQSAANATNKIPFETERAPWHLVPPNDISVPVTKPCTITWSSWGLSAGTPNPP